LTAARAPLEPFLPTHAEQRVGGLYNLSLSKQEMWTPCLNELIQGLLTYFAKQFLLRLKLMAEKEERGQGAPCINSHLNYSGVTPIRGFPLFRTDLLFAIYDFPLRFGQDRKVSHVTASWV